MDKGKILYNCRIAISLNPLTFAEALFVKDGKIRQLGNFSHISQSHPGMELHDGGGKFVLPPFYDGHVHFEFGGFLESLTSLENLGRDDILEVIREDPGKTQDDWILGGMYEKSSNVLDAKTLDDLHLRKPVLILSRDLHSAVLNSRAAKMFELDKWDDKGLLEYDAGGMFNGIIRESAVDEAIAKAHSPDKERIKKYLLLAQEKALSFGITGISDNVDEVIAEAYRELESEGLLRIKVDGWLNSRDFNPEIIEFSQYQGSHFRLKTLKGFLDGSFASESAFLREPFENTKDYRGFNRIDDRHLTQYLHKAFLSGWHVALHAIGDAALDQAIGAFKNAGNAKEMRNRVEHLQIVYPEQIRTMREMGLTASVQPAHLIHDWQSSEKMLSRERCKHVYPFRDMINEGMPLVFGTDWPVTGMDPRRGLHSAIYRKNENGMPENGWFSDQTLTPWESYQAYSSASKFAGGWKLDSQAGFSVGDDAEFLLFPDNILADSQNYLTTRFDLLIL